MTSQRSLERPETVASESQASLGQSEASQSSQGVSQPRARISSRSLMEENRALKADLAKRDKTVTKLSTQMSIKEAKVNLLNSKLTLEAYAKLAGRTRNSSLSDRDRIANWAMSLSEEAAEVTGALKKHLYHDHELDKETVIGELGDALWYVTAIAAELGVSLEEVAWQNVRKLERRYEDGFSAEASRNRND